MIALLGSTAAREWCPHTKTPVDMDILGTYDDVRAHIRKVMEDRLVSIYPIANGRKLVAKAKDGMIIEAEIAWPGSLAEELFEIIKADPYTRPWNVEERKTDASSTVLLPHIHVLYMLKMSHRYLKNSPHFLKTMTHIREMEEMGAFIQPEHFDFFKRREDATYDYKHPALNVAKSDFFNGDGVKYLYDHDSIHEAVKHLDRPAYTYFKPIGSEVMCSREMFELLPLRIRQLAVLEESYVLAAERSQLPFPDGKMKPFDSFVMALEKVCTSITSGWFREFAWNNYFEVLPMYNNNYMARIYQGIKDGVVVPYDPNKAY